MSTPRAHLLKKATTALSQWGHNTAALIMLSLVGCGTASVEDYRGQSPAFEPEQFFDGALTAHGVVKDFSGTAIRHFRAISRAAGRAAWGPLMRILSSTTGKNKSESGL